MKMQNEYQHFMKKELLHKSLNSLCGLLDGIVIDHEVTVSEQDEIRNWYDLHRHLIDAHPFSEIIPVLDSAFSDGRITENEAEDILWLCRKFLDAAGDDLYFNTATADMQFLEGMLHGILSDGDVSDTELKSLGDWLNDHDYLRGSYPYDEIYGLLLAAKEDGVISDDERNMLKAFFATFIDTSESYNIHETDIKSLQDQYSIGGICTVCPEINFAEHTFCFTGESRRAKRSEIADIISTHGGNYNDRVTSKTDYLIVGADGNPCWAFSCYGRKVEQAMTQRRKGHNVIIVHENDFWDEV